MKSIIKGFKWWVGKQKEVQSDRFSMLYLFGFCLFATFVLSKFIAFRSWLWWMVDIALVMAITEIAWFIIRNTKKKNE
jgi:hypothetical protein